jgi:hypothetical protein
MTIAREIREAETGVAAAYLPGVRGHAVLATGAMADGAEALAIWTLSALGNATGAWILPLATLDTERLLAVMHGMVRGRCLVGWTERSAATALAKVKKELPLALVARLRTESLAIPALIDETRAHRVRCEEELKAHGAAASSKIAPLAWPRPLPAPGAEAAALTPRHVSGASPVAIAALTVADALRNAIDLWQETEEARFRRRYLRTLGDQRLLPPRWAARLRIAESTPEA